MSEHHQPLPVRARLFTPGVMFMLLLVAIGVCFAVWRFIFGLEAATNLDHQHPWGLWIAIDVATGVALAAAGSRRARWHTFSTASITTPSCDRRC